MSVDQSPVYAVKAVPLEKIVANDYNPNIVAPGTFYLGGWFYDALRMLL